MKLFMDGHEMRYQAGNLCFLFFPGEKIEVETDWQKRGEQYAFTRLRARKNRISAFVKVAQGGRVRTAVSYAPKDAAGDEKQLEYTLGRAFYKAASRLCGFCPPWGILTGIRPAKIAREWMAEGMTPQKVEERFRAGYRVSPEKASLCVRTAGREARIIRLSRPESASLYISIPFCPSRCLYCSFISHDMKNAARLIPEYVRLLCGEIAAAGELARSLHLRLETIYMGGGTPTALSARELSLIFDAVKRSFATDFLREYTVEAGRPDTITPEKLAAIREGGAGRVCINPQTLSDRVLRNIGRKHTVKQVYEAFSLARDSGIESINMDLIAGLPGDTPEGFAKTVEGVIDLGPEAVTVHTLAMKRSSRLVTSGDAPFDARGEDAAKMLRIGYGKLDTAGYEPYYLYRQRNTLGNLENTGFAKPGRECLYNVFIMDETHTILAVGAGGVTKLRQPGGNRIERVFNFKYPAEYISRFDQVLARKRQVEEFYGSYNWTRKNCEK